MQQVLVEPKASILATAPAGDVLSTRSHYVLNNPDAIYHLYSLRSNGSDWTGCLNLEPGKRSQTHDENSTRFPSPQIEEAEKMEMSDSFDHRLNHLTPADWEQRPMATYYHGIAHPKMRSSQTYRWRKTCIVLLWTALPAYLYELHTAWYSHGPLVCFIQSSSISFPCPNFMFYRVELISEFLFKCICL